MIRRFLHSDQAKMLALLAVIVLALALSGCVPPASTRGPARVLPGGVTSVPTAPAPVPTASVVPTRGPIVPGPASSPVPTASVHRG